MHAYYIENGAKVDDYHWVEPIVDWTQYPDLESVLTEILSHDPDYLLLSCYVWNAASGHEILREIKRRRPEITTVIGGPNIEWDDPAYRLKHRWVDYICHPGGIGEEYIRCLLDDDTLPHGSLGDPLGQREFKWTRRSVYSYHLGYIQKMLDLARYWSADTYEIMFESNRGCPFACTYCEWGGAIGTKYLRKPWELIMDDIQTLASLKVKWIGIVDSNFGIFDQDVKIMEEFGKNGMVILFLYGLAKTTVKKKRAILEAMFANNSATTYNMSLQTLSPEVMKNIKRTDIPLEDNMQIARDLQARYNCDVAPEFIIGLPGMTWEEFLEQYNIIFELKSWDATRYYLSVLPTAEMGTKANIEKFKMKIVKVRTPRIYDMHTRYFIDAHPKIQPSYLDKITGYSMMAVGSYSFTTDDWKKMAWTNSAVFGIMHGHILSHWYPRHSGKEIARAVGETLMQYPEYQMIDQQLEEVVQNRWSHTDWNFFGPEQITMGGWARWWVQTNPEKFIRELARRLDEHDENFIEYSWKIIRTTEEVHEIVQDRWYIKGTPLGDLLDFRVDYSGLCEVIMEI